MELMSTSTATVSLVALAFIGLVIASRAWHTTERVERVDVRGARLLSTEEVMAQARVAPRMSFGSIDLADVRARLLAHPLVHGAAIVRERNTLILNVTERVPAARVMLGGAMRLVDVDGTLFPLRPVNALLDLPLICGVAIGDSLDGPALHDALALLKAADGRDGLCGLISTVRRTSDGTFWMETTGDAVPVRVGTAADASQKFGLLQSFLPQLMRPRAGQGRAEYVDLRFRDQVVVRWSGAPAVQ